MSTGEHDLDATDTEAPEPDAAAAKLDMDVQITDVGPCKKHVKITIARGEIDRQFADALGTLKREAQVPGFRPGRAPKQLVEKRFRKEMAEQVKVALVTECLKQLDADFDLEPIAQPTLDVAAIELPDEGPMQFELDIEVQPEFALPAYQGFTIQVPVKTITEADVDAQETAFREQNAPLVPKLEGGAAAGDFVIADLTFLRDGATYKQVKEVTFRLASELRFPDGAIPKLDETLRGVEPGQTRRTVAQIGSGAADPSLRGGTLDVIIQVHDLKQLRLPELDAAFLRAHHFESREQFRAALRQDLERRIQTQQREAVRRAILDALLRQTRIELPADLVARQEAVTIRRLAAQLREGGLSDSEIRAREAEIRANAHETTRRSLAEFFLLAKIAEAERISVSDEDVALELESIAARTDESPRRVRARLEKEGTSDALIAQILERKTIARILEYVAYKEIPFVEPPPVETLDQAATVAADPAAAPSEPTAPAGASPA
jgi:trigger factor